MNQRIEYFDILRGIAIIGVIAIHSSEIGYKFPDMSVEFRGTVIWRQLINFSVPLFLAISGYFAANKETNNEASYLIFVKKQIPRVFIPYVFWSVIYSIPIILHDDNSLKDVVFKFITFQITGPFYYILLIIQYYILLPILKKMATTKGVLIAGLISGFSCLTIYITRYCLSIDIPLFIYAGFFPTWIVFFVIGIFIRKNGINTKSNILLSFLILSFVLSVVETYYLYIKFNDIGNSVTAVKITSFIYSITAILFLFKQADKKNFNFKFLSYLGKISFGIYLSHMIVLSILARLFNKFLPLLSLNGIVYQIALIVSILICSSLIAFFVRRVNINLAVKYMGQ